MINSIPNFFSKNYYSRQTKYCLCIPVINEGEKIITQLKKINNLGLENEVDIVLCDGGSTDGSTDEQLLKSLHVNTLLVKTDVGKLSAQLRMGYSWALNQGYEGIITVDGNGKDSMESIPLFIKGLDEGYDFLQGSRFIKGGEAINTPKIRHLAVQFIHAPIISLTAKHRFTDTTNGYRAYSKKYLLDERVQPFRDIFNTYELLAYLSVRASQLGFKVKEIPVTRKYPNSGKIPTKISFFRGNLSLIRILINNLLGKYNPT